MTRTFYVGKTMLDITFFYVSIPHFTDISWVSYLHILHIGWQPMFSLSEPLVALMSITLLALNKSIQGNHFTKEFTHDFVWFLTCFH